MTLHGTKTEERGSLDRSGSYLRERGASFARFRVYPQVMKEDPPECVAFAVISMGSRPARMRQFDKRSAVCCIGEVETDLCSNGVAWTLDALPLKMLRWIKPRDLPAKRRVPG